MTSNKSFHWLDRTTVKSDFMSKVVAEYRVASKNSFAVKAEKKYKASKNHDSNYIGAAAVQVVMPVHTKFIWTSH